MNQGWVADKLGLKGISPAAEESMVARDIRLAAITGGHCHIAHVSTSGSVELIKRAKEDGINITCEVTPHHLTLTDELIMGTSNPDEPLNNQSYNNTTPSYIIEPGNVFFMHMILMDSDNKLAMNLGATYLVTENGNERLGKQKLDLVIL